LQHVAGRSAPDGPGWEEFESRLAAALGRMKPDTFLVLTVSTPRSGGPGPYVQYAHSGRRGFRAEASGNHFLAAPNALSPEAEELLGELGWQWPEPAGGDDRNFHREWPNPAPWGEVAALSVRTLRDVFGVVSPGSLRYLHRGFLAFEGRLPRLDLGIPAERMARDRADAEPGREPALAGLNRRLEDALKAFLGLPELIRDSDGDIPVRVGSALMYVRAVAGTPPLVQLFATVLDDVELTPPLLEAINDINRRILFGRIFWGHRGVIVAMELTGVGMTPEQVSFACVQLGNLADHLDDELRARFGPPDDDRPKRQLVN
jgi:hypothetical protein